MGPLLLPCLVSGIVSVSPSGACPAPDAIEAELRRIGALSAVEAVGRAEVEVHEASLHLVLRDREGLALGVREVRAPRECRAQVAVAAVVIAAWAGEWAETGLGQRAAVRNSEMAVPPTRGTGPAPATGVTPDTVPGQSLHGELGASGFGVHDGDSGTWGLGVQGGLGRGWLFMTIMIDGSGERTRPLGPGQAVYRDQRLALGPCLRKAWPLTYVDLTLAPQVVRLSLQGSNLEAPRSTTVWGLAVDARVRLGLELGRLAPFLYVADTVDLLRDKLKLDDRQDVVRLSLINLAVGAGILVHLNK